MQKVRLFLISIMNTGILLLILCLGSQNINNRQSINLGFTSTAKLPAGFLVGVSICLGAISGSATTLILAKTIINGENNDI